MIQSFIFAKSYGVKRAIAYLKKNKHRYDDIDYKINTIRFRQREPLKKHIYYIETISKNIKAVMMFPLQK